MYRVRIADLQSYLPSIDESDNFQVDYTNFVIQADFGFLFAMSYSLVSVSPKKLIASQKLNFYLKVKDITRSCFIWISESNRNTLIAKYYVDRDIFVKEEVSQYSQPDFEDDIVINH